MVANKLFKKSVFILLFIVSAAFTFAQKVGDRNYKLVSINGEKVYRWMECLEVVEYYENGTIRTYNKKYDYDTFSDHLGQRNWAVTNPEKCCIDYIKTTKLDYTDGAGNPIINTTLKRFSNGKLVYERSIGGDGWYTAFYEYNVNGRAIIKKLEEYAVSYYEEYDSKGNLVSLTEKKGDFYDGTWFEYDKEGKPFRYFTKENGWENLTEDKKMFEINSGVYTIINFEDKNPLKELKIESIPDSYWKGNITYWINYTSPTSYQGFNGMQFEINPKGQLVSYKTEYYAGTPSGRDSGYKLTEQYEYDSEGRETVYKYSDFSDNLDNVFCEEHYDYNKKGNKVRYTATFFDWEWEGSEKRFFEKNVEKGTFNAKGNKSHFTDTEGNEGYYFYEYYPSGAVKTRRKYKYLTLEKEEY